MKARKPMRIFISAGEPSGDIHGANLIRALRRLYPEVDCVGFGGERMEAAGCRLLYPLCQLAVMWFLRVFANSHIFLRLLSLADRFFRRRPDAVVLIDYPGFHWWLARRAHFHGIPVYYFVPPQLWGWAGWRVGKMRRFVDHVLCVLPFEEKWYQERGVSAYYVGHPFFDELPAQKLDGCFLAHHRPRSGPIVGLLPGSRSQEVERNLSTLVRAARLIHAARPDVRFLAACFKPAQQQYVDGYLRAIRCRPADGLPSEKSSESATKTIPSIETFVGRTPEIIELAHSCLAVSGSVGLELLYRGKPTVVLYRIGRIDLRVARFFKKSPYISLVNLLAGKELFPEFLTDRCEAEAISRHILRWLNDPAAYDRTHQEMAKLKQAVAEPGACERAARFILSRVDPLSVPPPLGNLRISA
jgi:lipid-A-disaccharide synthase